MNDVPLIAFDIDDVILDTFSILIDEFKKKYNVDLVKPTRYCIEKDCKNLTVAEVSDTIDSALLRVNDFTTIEGSIEFLKFYQSLTGKDLMFVTSRRKDLAEATYDTLGRYIDNFIIFFSEKPYKTKRDILARSKVNIFIEDRAKYCNEVSDLDILVLMLKKSWNTHVDDKENIIKVDNWLDIFSIFYNIYRKGNIYV